MRISDWSSDVCSSDLLLVHRDRGHPAHQPHHTAGQGGQRQERPPEWEQVGPRHQARPANRSFSRPSSPTGPWVPLASRKYSSPQNACPLSAPLKKNPSSSIWVRCALSAAIFTATYSVASTRAAN